MEVATTSRAETSADLPIEDYRAISKPAVFGLILGLAGIAGFLSPVFLFLPVLAAVTSFLGLYQIGRFPDELSGRGPGRFGLALGLFTLVGGGAWHGYVYATEVPEDAQRVAFWELMADTRPAQPKIPPTALQLDGQRIFIKGYVHPGVADSGAVDNFLLVPDMGTCCFGGQPQLTHMIDVQLAGNLRIKYSYRKRALAGILRVDPRVTAADGSQGPCYRLEADFLN